MKNWIWAVLIVFLAVLLLASASFYTVNQSQNALLMQFGKQISVQKAPGLYLKWPVLQNVEYVDKRLQNYSPQPVSFLTQDKKPLLLSYFAEWQVVNPGVYYARLHDQANAQTQIGDVLRAALRSQIATMSMEALIAARQQEISSPVMQAADQHLSTFGIRLVDLRILQVGLPPELLQATYKRMEAEQTQQANTYHSQGKADAEQIRASAEKEKTSILADAYRQQEQIKGQGDAEAASIYGDAYGKDPKFFAFYRSLEAYRHALSDKTVLVLNPDSPFFKYFRHSLNEAGK
ncbi:protease modulator HflC [Acidithiobacillus albertensis]|uniref:protease modulator HflC n=1 Tax=Acidithiobacillus albertensis TaxID=119978 RepID=UPI001C072B89|nr:protease modulator HflC [Acidithiobacillus albertensis]MBU2741156.1 protease modulator HflC [Acidithiobacillus albertensis]